MPKSVRNSEKRMLGTLETWSMSHLSQQPSKPAYYIEDCQILVHTYGFHVLKTLESSSRY